MGSATFLSTGSSFCLDENPAYGLMHILLPHRCGGEQRLQDKYIGDISYILGFGILYQKVLLLLSAGSQKIEGRCVGVLGSNNEGLADVGHVGDDQDMCLGVNLNSSNTSVLSCSSGYCRLGYRGNRFCW